MRSPERDKQSEMNTGDSSCKFERLYWILFNEELFYVAYQKIASNRRGTTKRLRRSQYRRDEPARIETLTAR